MLCLHTHGVFCLEDEETVGHGLSCTLQHLPRVPRALKFYADPEYGMLSGSTVYNILYSRIRYSMEYVVVQCNVVCCKLLESCLTGMAECHIQGERLFFGAVCTNSLIIWCGIAEICKYSSS